MKSRLNSTTFFRYFAHDRRDRAFNGVESGIEEKATLTLMPKLANVTIVPDSR